MSKNRKKPGKAHKVWGVILMGFGAFCAVGLVASIITASVHHVRQSFSMIPGYIILIVLTVGPFLLGLRLFRGPEEERWKTDNPARIAKLQQKVRQMTSDEDRLRAAGMTNAEDVYREAFTCVKNQAALGAYVCNPREDYEKRTAAIEYLTDPEQLYNIAVTCVPKHAERAVDRLIDADRLRALGENEKAAAAIRVRAYERINDAVGADQVRVASDKLSAAERKQAAERLLALRNIDVIEKTVLMVLKQKPDEVGKDFLVASVQQYPKIFRKLWPQVYEWTHNDQNRHTDTGGAPHIDRTEYYDYYRYPDGRTVANRSGRRKHTDTHMASSDCTEYNHTDTRHSDGRDQYFLSKFPAFIKGETAESTENTPEKTTGK